MMPPMVPGMPSEPQPIKRLYIFTYPRTASSLLVRILNLPNQPGVISTKGGGYFFLPANQRLRELHLLQRCHDQWPDPEKAEVHALYHQCFAKLQDFVASTEAVGQTVVIKEHVPHMVDPVSKSKYVHETGAFAQPFPKDNRTKLSNLGDTSPTHFSLSGINNTVLPDEFLLGWLPTFLIRHPALAFPSYYRIFWRNCQGCEKEMAGLQKDLSSSMTLRWTRQLYDWYAGQCVCQEASLAHRQKPIVLDADDVLANPDILVRFCDMVGLDPRQLCFQWEPTKPDQLHEVDPLTRQMNATLLSSSGIIQNMNDEPIDLEKESLKWKSEFGEAGGSWLTQWVQDSILDYEYLRSRRLV